MISNIVPNLYYIGDNLTLLKKKLSNNFIDLIYFDPPYNTGRNFLILTTDLKVLRII